MLENVRAVLFMLISTSSFPISHCKFSNGIVSIDSDGGYISKFSFMSVNGSIHFEVAYPETYSPLRLQAYWDSPIAWVDSFNMRLSCSKKQAILRRLSASQVIHLEPNLNSWCQRMPISNQVVQELSLNSYEDKADDWSVVFASILQKISGAVEAAREWLSPLGPPDNRMKTASHMKPSVANNVTQKEVPTIQPIHQKSRLPHVVQVAWETLAKSSDPEAKNYMQNLIYCKSPTIPLRFTRPVWWFFMLERCQEEQTQSVVDSSKQSPRTSELGTPRRVTGLHAVYQLSLRNGIVGDLFHEHFSAQKFGSLEMDIVFLLFLLVLLCLAGVVASMSVLCACAFSLITKCALRDFSRLRMISRRFG
ncbi:hypothetical protein PHET_08846 [Paragonimus heterotremus]|uniref:GPR180-like N-terminal domain-containing protein n=1 Tax=Paragonimus heterotremus TaxID=100268 RepID=A0A8J4WF63_9TREM|nr:hypothetical protein PHET_08846 [Paragonimus heterotremus]